VANTWQINNIDGRGKKRKMDPAPSMRLVIDALAS
jgi:hypothetical protein